MFITTALAHVISDESRASIPPLTWAALAQVSATKPNSPTRRSGALEKRRKVLEAWAVYCEAPKSSKVVTFQLTFRTRRWITVNSRNCQIA